MQLPCQIFPFMAKSAWQIHDRTKQKNIKTQKIVIFYHHEALTVKNNLYFKENPENIFQNNYLPCLMAVTS